MRVFSAIFDRLRGNSEPTSSIQNEDIDAAVEPTAAHADDTVTHEQSNAHMPSPVMLATPNGAPRIPFSDLKPGPLETARRRAGVAFAFDAAQPVRSQDALRGRGQKLQELLSAVLFQRTHAIVYGARGSGKTSLVRVFGDYADQDGVFVFYMACVPEAEFADLIVPYLEHIPPTCFAPEIQDGLQDRLARMRCGCTPRDVVNFIADIRYSRVVFVFDEFDRVTNPATRIQISSLLKLSSDARTRANFVLVGIAQNLEELIDAHQSLRRHLAVVSIGPLDDEEIGEVLEYCADASDLKLSATAKDLIADHACGSPYHARLFGMHAGFAAVDKNHGEISNAEVYRGLRTAFAEWRAFSPGLAQAFENLAQSGNIGIGAITHFARTVAYCQPFDAAEVSQLLSSGKTQGAASDLSKIASKLGDAIEIYGDQIIFKDSTAPQFLLVACAIREKAECPPLRTIEKAKA